MPKIFISPEDRASNVYASTALWNGRTTNEKEQMGRLADDLEIALKRCGFEVINAQYGDMYDRVRDSNAWPADLHVAPHTNGFDGTVAGTRVHCYPAERSRKIGRLIQTLSGKSPKEVREYLTRNGRGMTDVTLYTDLKEAARGLLTGDIILFVEFSHCFSYSDC